MPASSTVLIRRSSFLGGAYGPSLTLWLRITLPLVLQVWVAWVLVQRPVGWTRTH